MRSPGEAAARRRCRRWCKHMQRVKLHATCSCDAQTGGSQQAGTGAPMSFQTRRPRWSMSRGSTRHAQFKPHKSRGCDALARASRARCDDDEGAGCAGGGRGNEASTAGSDKLKPVPNRQGCRSKPNKSAGSAMAVRRRAPLPLFAFWGTASARHRHHCTMLREQLPKHLSYAASRFRSVRFIPSGPGVMVQRLFCFFSSMKRPGYRSHLKVQ